MVKRESSGARDATSQLPTLQTTVVDAEQRITERIEKGKAIRALPLDSEDMLSQANEQYYKWNDYNGAFLRKLFSTDELSKDYSFSYSGIGSESFTEERDAFLTKIDRKIRLLESIMERLPLYDSAEKKADQPKDGFQTARKVFVVHGRDTQLKESVARFLERLDLDPVILHEAPNAGQTIIEKFEKHSNASFAVVLLTPDDVGGLAEAPDDLKQRARQNVIFELGYFFAKLGRGRVCALYAEGVELPSDLDGVVYVEIDEKGAWKMELARELKAAKIDVDLNRAI